MSLEKKQIQNTTKIPTSIKNKGKKGSRDFLLVEERCLLAILCVPDNTMTFARRARV